MLPLMGKNKSKKPSKTDATNLQVSILHCSIPSFGMVDALPIVGRQITQTRTAEIIRDVEYFSMRVNFVADMQPEVAGGESVRILWVSAVYRIKIDSANQSGEIIETFNSKDGVIPQLPAELLINLVQMTYSSLRGVVAMLVRGSWLNDFVPSPESVSRLVEMKSKDEAITNIARQTFV